jgi:hypothetical protein
VIEKASAKTLVEARVLEMSDNLKQFFTEDTGTELETNHGRELVRRRNPEGCRGAIATQGVW